VKLSEKLREMAWDSDRADFLHECCDALDAAESALVGCIEHMEWSSEPGRAAYDNASAAVIKLKGDNHV
jgi:hypothetical protein